MNELERRKKSLEKLGKLVAQRHHHNDVACRRDGASLVDERALRLGRYLRAARKNADLSPQELADRAGLSLATVLALEQGLILNQEVKAAWLRKIAAALGEDVNSFRLLLGQRLLPPRRKNLFNFGWLRWPQPQMQPVYATLSAALLCMAVSAIIWLHPPRSLYPAFSVAPDYLATAKKTTLIDIGSKKRLNMTNAEEGLESQITLRPAFATRGATPTIAAPTLPALSPKNQGLDMATLVDISAEDRLNMINAEFRLGNQARILRTLINISAEDRQNMVKAEIRL